MYPLAYPPYDLAHRTFASSQNDKKATNTCRRGTPQSMLMTGWKLGCIVFMTGLAFAVPSCGGPKAVDLHKVDWANVTLPGSICGASHPIRLHRHKAVVASTFWPRYPRVSVDSGWNPIAYGDIDGDGRDEAALVVDCNNGGGTASGVLAYAQVIFTAVGKSPRVIGVVIPRSQGTYGAPLVQVNIRQGKIVAHEAWYGPNDGTSHRADQRHSGCIRRR